MAEDEKSERTKAQRYADYKKRFSCYKNERRVFLIHKKYMGTGLTQEEKKELDELQKWMDKMIENAPWEQNAKPFREVLDRKLDELQKRLGGK